MQYKVSKQLESELLRVLSTAEGTPCLFSVTVLFHASGSDWTFSPEYVTGYNIVQNFTQNFMDDVQLALELHPLDIIDILNHLTDLKCTITLVPYSWRTYFSYEEHTNIEEYRVILEDATELSKKYKLDEYSSNDRSLTEMRKTEIRMPVTMQLLKEQAYDLRHKSVNSAFGDGTSPAQAVHWVLDAFKLDKAEIKEVTNTQTFKNLSIPLEEGHIDRVFPYLQRAYGLYAKGIAAYYHDEQFYIWSPYDTDPTTPTTLHIYCAAIDSFEGTQCYHLEKDDRLELVINERPATKSLAEVESENQGSVQLSLNADTLIDHHDRLSSAGTVVAGPNNLTALGKGDDRTAVSNAVNVRYNTPTTNVYAASSQLAASQIVLFSCMWKQAAPLLVYPGQKVIIHFDNDRQEYCTQKGIVAGMQYKLIRTENRGLSKPFYVFHGGITCFLEPEQRTTEQSSALTDPMETDTFTTRVKANITGN